MERKREEEVSGGKERIVSGETETERVREREREERE